MTSSPLSRSGPVVRAIRRRCELQGRLVLPEEVASVRVIDLSETGAFVETKLELQAGALGTLELDLLEGGPWCTPVEISRTGKGQQELRHARVEIVTVSRQGVGVRFLELSGPDRARLDALLLKIDQG